MHGFDSVFEIVSLGIDFGLISKKGSWFEYTDSLGELIKEQGQSKLVNYFNNNKMELELLYEQIKESAV